MLDDAPGVCRRPDQTRAVPGRDRGGCSSGDEVADLGCGSGVLSLLCLHAGAGQVFGINSTAMPEVARETFALAGLPERSRFIRDHSLRVELPEQVDLVIRDGVGYFGFDYGIVSTLQEARLVFSSPPALFGRLHACAGLAQN